MRRSRRAAVVLVSAALAVAGVASPAAAAILPHFVVADFGVNSGWQVDRHIRLVTDITGDGRADIVGFGNRGVFTAVANASGGFGEVRLVVQDLGFDQGWRLRNNPPAGDNSVITPRFVTDITGDGRADLVGVHSAGVLTAVARGDGTFGSLTFLPGTFTATGCSSVFTADVTGDRRSDLICHNNRNMRIAVARGDGGFDAPVLATTEIPVSNAVIVFADLDGDLRAELLWTDTTTAPLQIRTARPNGVGGYGPSFLSGAPGFPTATTFADATGDGRLDWVGFGTRTTLRAGVGNGTFGAEQFGNDSFGTNESWTSQSRQPRFVADVTGDRRADVIGFGDDGVYTAVFAGQSFRPKNFVIADLGANQGWQPSLHVRTVADVTGDGRADVIAFGAAGVYVAVAVGDGTFR
jgi:hypothetical protein